MALEVKWSAKGSKSLYQITTYLEEYLSQKSLIEFIDNVFDCIDQILAFPEIGVIEIKETKLRSYLINKNLRLFLSYNENENMPLNLSKQFTPHALYASIKTSVSVCVTN